MFSTLDQHFLINIWVNTRFASAKRTLQLSHRLFVAQAAPELHERKKLFPQLLEQHGSLSAVQTDLAVQLLERHAVDPQRGVRELLDHEVTTKWQIQHAHNAE